jgi:hypothetical protein
MSEHLDKQIQSRIYYKEEFKMTEAHIVTVGKLKYYLESFEKEESPIGLEDIQTRIKGVNTIKFYAWIQYIYQQEESEDGNIKRAGDPIKTLILAGDDGDVKGDIENARQLWNRLDILIKKNPQVVEIPVSITENFHEGSIGQISLLLEEAVSLTIEGSIGDNFTNILTFHEDYEYVGKTRINSLYGYYAEESEVPDMRLVYPELFDCSNIGITFTSKGNEEIQKEPLFSDEEAEFLLAGLYMMQYIDEATIIRYKDHIRQHYYCTSNDPTKLELEDEINRLQKRVDWFKAIRISKFYRESSFNLDWDDMTLDARSLLSVNGDDLEHVSNSALYARNYLHRAGREVIRNNLVKISKINKSFEIDISESKSLKSGDCGDDVIL